MKFTTTIIIYYYYDDDDDDYYSLQLVEINGVQMLNVLHQEALNALQLNKNSVELLVARSPQPIEVSALSVLCCPCPSRNYTCPIFMILFGCSS